MSARLDGRVALVTGAGAGDREAIARRFAVDVAEAAVFLAADESRLRDGERDRVDGGVSA